MENVNQRGFTLVETMVALLILSVGLIGIAALYGQALSASSASIFRSQAINLAADIADRIRGNRTALLAYQGSASNHGCDAPTDRGGIDCAADEMAAHDLFVWQTLTAETLPGGQGTVEVDTTTDPATYTVTVFWDEASQDRPATFSVDFLLASY